MNLNGAFRKRKTTYTVISNHAIDNDRLSPQAYYLYSKICRYLDLPEHSDFILTKGFLFSKSNMSEKTFDKYWKELQNEGYLKVFQSPDKENKGKFITEYELLEVADTLSAYYTQYNGSGEIIKELFPVIKAIVSVKKKTYNTNNKKVREIAEKARAEANENDCNAVPPKKGGAVKAGDAKLGGLSITDLSNTNKSNTILSSSDKMDDDSFYEENLNSIMKLCQELNFKIKKKDVKILLQVYTVEEIKKEIISSSDYEIKTSYIRYLKAALKNSNTPKIVNTNVAGKEDVDDINPKSFINFKAREYDYDDLEKKLLGWDK